jgi:hypothetical protein
VLVIQAGNHHPRGIGTRTVPPSTLQTIGLRETLAPVVARRAAVEGWAVIGWNRDTTPPDDAAACQAWLESQRPRSIAHLATGSVEWARQIAAYSERHSVPLVFTSTVSVFHHLPNGPHRVDDERNSPDPYGQYKRECKDAVQHANPAACVARLGWQMHAVQQGSNMLVHGRHGRWDSLAAPHAGGALGTRKGRRGHALWGRAFALGMLVVFLTTLLMMFTRPNLFLLCVAVLSFYLVLTG